MAKETILTGLGTVLGDAVLSASDTPGMPVLTIRAEALLTLVRIVRQSPYRLDIFLDLTCLDDPLATPRFTVVYHFASFESPARLRVKVPLAGNEPAVDSLTPFWPNAAWLEREVYDLFGVRFIGHPDLKRILLYDGFSGHPLRKDYPLRGRRPRRAEEDIP